MNLTTTLWLVRHGQTDWNLTGHLQGQTDIPLNDTGTRQAQELAACLAGRSFDAIYSSDLSRAHQTALAIAHYLQKPVRLDPRLREIHQGQWEGLLLSELIAASGDGRHQMHHGNWSTWRPPGGESVVDVAERAWAAADDICSSHPGGQVLLVGHGLCLATLICRAEGIPLEHVYERIPDNCAARKIAWPARAG